MSSETSKNIAGGISYEDKQSIHLRLHHIPNVKVKILQHHSAKLAQENNPVINKVDTQETSHIILKWSFSHVHMQASATAV
jgi:hypothetical protein